MNIAGGLLRMMALSRKTRYPLCAVTLLALTALLMACAGPGLREPLVPAMPGYALPAATEGKLAGIANRIAASHGPEASGFLMLDANKAALDWRLALVDSATSSIDIQTYLWYPDNAGRLLLERVVNAAKRGVHVRLIVDDLLTIGLDQTLVELETHPNIEFRLFNPWKKRHLGARAGEMLVEMERLNIRMHNKLVIVDGVATIIGGRNIGDHYFGLSHDYNFSDLDILAFGRAAQQAEDMFDHFWNSEWVVSVQNLDIEPDAKFAAKAWSRLQAKNQRAPELAAFPREPVAWTKSLDALETRLHTGTSVISHDEAGEEAIAQNMGGEMFAFFERARQELLVTNAYIIPGPPGIELVQQLTDRGVDVKILTNSLASHDVPAVNSHYRDWRDELINAGAELYELRADAQIRPWVDTPPVEGKFVSLHTKAAVVDGRYVFVGSMNLDPRSVHINTESGIFIDSPGLARELAGLMNRDMDPVNAWQVRLDANGKPYWTNSDETVERQPARNFFQRIMDVVFRVFPKDYY